MKKILFLAILYFIVYSNQSYAQTKLLTLEETVLKQRTSLAPKKLNQLQWIKGTNQYAFVDEDQFLKIGDATKPNESLKEGISKSEINKQLLLAKQDTSPTFLTIKSTTNDEYQFKTLKGILVIARSSKGKTHFILDPKLPDNAENQDAENEKSNIAYTIENNLFVYQSKTEKNFKVTKDKDINIVNGKSVHREEFGIFKGTFWSHSGDYLAFYRMDQTMVTDYAILDLNKQPAGVKIIKYPMAGAKSHEVTIGIYKLSNGKITYLNTGLPKEQYLTNVCWSPDEKSIYVAVLNRDQNEMQFNQYDVKTGRYMKTLFQEKNNKYVQPLNPMLFVEKNQGLFVWQSKKDGFNNAYLYNTEGQLIRNLTQKDPVSGLSLEVTSVYGFDKEGKYLFFQAVPKDNIIRNIYKAEVSSGKISLLSNVEGVNTGQFSEDGNFYLNTITSLKIPRNIDLFTTEGTKVKNLLTADNPLKDYKMPTTELFNIKAEDGTPLFCRLIKPIDFDPSKKYPVMVYIYGGPGIQLITNSWLGNGDMFLQYMAQNGFVVFTLDNRGTANRGIEFEQTTFRQLGSVEINDQLKGVEYLISLPYVDKDRMGIFGWSYGGFMTTSLMTRTPGIFKAAVAGGPVIDWGYYEVMYTERYMDTPQTNEEGYKKANLFNYVSDLKGKLLMIHGTSDDVVVWQQSLLYQKAAIEKGIQLDYYVYPGHLHNVIGRDRVHLMKKESSYLLNNL